MQKLTATSGFSLIELMLALVLLGVIGVGIGFAYNGFLQNHITTKARVELHFDSTIALNQIRNAVTGADTVILAQGGDNATCLIITSPTTQKTVYRFAASAASQDLDQLWVLDAPDASLNRCEPPSPDTGWQLAHPSHWRITAQPPFSLTDGVLTIHAEVARKIGTKILSVADNSIVLAQPRRRHLGLCKIAPAITGFDTGGEAIAEAVIRFDTNSFEAGLDTLGFTDAILNSTNAAFDTFKAIRSGGVIIWPNITADFNHTSGEMRICTTTGANCTAPDNTTHDPDAWYKVLREVIYTPSPQGVIARKDFTITLGGDSPVAAKRIMLDAHAFIKNCR